MTDQLQATVRPHNSLDTDISASFKDAKHFEWTSNWQIEVPSANRVQLTRRLKLTRLVMLGGTDPDGIAYSHMGRVLSEGFTTVFVSAATVDGSGGTHTWQTITITSDKEL